MNQIHFLGAAALSAALALCGTTSHAQPAPGEMPAVNAAPADKLDADNRTVIFITARIIRRAGDETARAPEAGATKLGMIR